MEPAEEAAPAVDANSSSELDRVYLDLTPVKAFLHSPSEVQVAHASLPVVPHQDDIAETLTVDPKPGTTPEEPHTESPGGLETQQVQAILSTGTSHLAKPCSHRMVCDFSLHRGSQRVRSLRSPSSPPRESPRLSCRPSSRESPSQPTARTPWLPPPSRPAHLRRTS